MSDKVSSACLKLKGADVIKLLVLIFHVIKKLNKGGILINLSTFDYWEIGKPRYYIILTHEPYNFEMTYTY